MQLIVQDTAFLSHLGWGLRDNVRCSLESS